MGTTEEEVVINLFFDPVSFSVYVIWYWSFTLLVLEYLLVSTAFEVNHSTLVHSETLSLYQLSIPIVADHLLCLLTRLGALGLDGIADGDVEQQALALRNTRKTFDGRLVKPAQDARAKSERLGCQRDMSRSDADINQREIFILDF